MGCFASQENKKCSTENDSYLAKLWSRIHLASSESFTVKLANFEENRKTWWWNRAYEFQSFK